MMRAFLVANFLLCKFDWGLLRMHQLIFSVINGQSNPYSPTGGGHYQYIDIARRSVNGGTHAKKATRNIDSYHVGPMIDSISGPSGRVETNKLVLPNGRAVKSLTAMVPYAAQKLARDSWTLPSMDIGDLYKLKRAR